MKLCFSSSLRLAVCSVLLAFGTSLRADWTLSDAASPDAPGRQVDIKDGDRLVARFIYGEGQLKPYLHLFADNGDPLTKWSEKQQYPHHRGIYIGWNQIQSDLGRFDLWHLNQGGKMTLLKLEKLTGGKDSATLVATIEWRGGTNSSNLLITETRTMTVSRPGGKAVQVDTNFKLHAARDLNLGGDLQHAGAHLRVHEGVVARQKETSYLWSPANLEKSGDKLVGNAIQWCRFLFPIEDRWYAATQFNSPQNPVEELSTRAYGRFGFFFKKAMKKDEAFSLNYRFLVEPAEAPEQKPQPSAAQSAKARSETEARYAAFAKSLKR